MQRAPLACLRKRRPHGNTDLTADLWTGPQNLRGRNGHALLVKNLSSGIVQTFPSHHQLPRALGMQEFRCAGRSSKGLTLQS